MRFVERAPLAAVTLIAVLSLTAVPVAAEAEGPARTFRGQYDWKDGGKGELTAEFEPDGDGAWTVKFRFVFQGRQNTWNGTAEGSLDEDGEINGTAAWKGRNWVFVATLADGVMSGSHTELLRDGGRYDTGTFEIRR